MQLTARDRRALALLGPGALAVLIIWFAFFRDTQPKVVAATSSLPLAQRRLDKLRRIAASVPAKQAAEKQVSEQLAAREKGILTADTAPQAQAKLLEIARRIGKRESIDVRGGDFPAPRALGDYGEVSAAVSFECPIERFENFVAALSAEPELIAPTELRIAPGPNAKEKTVVVRMTLAGIVPRKLIPEKKGLQTF